jgi:hypothetical protein
MDFNFQLALKMNEMAEYNKDVRVLFRYRHKYNVYIKLRAIKW